MNHQPQVSLLSFTQPLRLECNLLEDVMNYVYHTKEHRFIFELGHDPTKTPWRRVTMLSRGSSEEDFPSAHLDPYGFKMIIGVRSFLGDLQGVAFQHPMECTNKNMIWDKGSVH